jgi:hypothetical protein
LNLNVRLRNYERSKALTKYGLGMKMSGPLKSLGHGSEELGLHDWKRPKDPLGDKPPMPLGKHPLQQKRKSCERGALSTLLTVRMHWYAQLVKTQVLKYYF